MSSVIAMQVRHFLNAEFNALNPLISCDDNEPIKHRCLALHFQQNSLWEILNIAIFILQSC